MNKEQMEELQKNEFYNKYADKIAKLQKWVTAIRHPWNNYKVKIDQDFPGRVSRAD